MLAALRPMGRATSGVIGMRFRSGDELLAMMVARPDAFVFTATDGGFAKRTPIEEYPVQGRGGQGVLTAKITDGRGGLVGALMVDPGDEVFAITSGGGVIRTRADEVRPTSRATMGVRLINLANGDAVVGVTRNAESAAGVDDELSDGELSDGELSDGEPTGAGPGGEGEPAVGETDRVEHEGASGGGVSGAAGPIGGNNGQQVPDSSTTDGGPAARPADLEQGDS